MAAIATRRSLRWALAGALAVTLLVCRAAGAAGSPLESTALWVNQAGPATALASEAEQAGVSTLFLKAAEGTTPEAAYTPALVGALRSAGISVCAWTFVRGAKPLAEANVAIAAVHAGAQCLVVDAEGEYDSRYGAAQAFVRRLRSALGETFPIGLAGQAEVLEHPKFPYSVFLGVGGFRVDMPQVYWHDLGLTPSAALGAAVGINAIYGRVIAPVGQLYGGVSTGEIGEFVGWAYSLQGTHGLSLFDLDVAEPAALAEILHGVFPAIARIAAPPTIRPGADGDEIVFAQELLNAAGAKLPVGGFFGAQTSRAVARFQRRHRLHVNGLLDTNTWRALSALHAHPREPSWAHGPPLSAR